MPRAPTISVKAVGKILDAALAAGVRPRQLCRAVELDPALLEDAENRIPYAQLVALYEAAARLTGDTAFGLHLSERASPRAFDLLGYVMLNSPTLGEAVGRIIRYHSIWTDGATYSLEIEGDVARLGYRYVNLEADACRQDCEMTLGITLRFARLATGVDWTPLEVGFAHAEPADTSEHRRIFRGPVRFSRPANLIVFDRALLNLAMEGADPALCAVLDRHAEELLAKFPGRGGFAGEVRALLFEALSGGDASLETISQQLGTSPRTLQRKLKEEGATHQVLLDELRRDLSKRYLSEPQMAISEVAYLLGFSEPSAFHRAFRRWTGITPREYRRSAQV
ncbi:MAG TPA: AraC family transcriptional regulator [Pyrinomonadaceae bacterium]|jgi:AraC-like DNA-binding protein|nr:AraC family transcriptional regulator [Pyrinomonadaceae bacterium]